MNEFNINEAKSEFFSKSKRKQRKILKKDHTEALKLHSLVNEQIEAEKLNSHMDSKRELKTLPDLNTTNTELAEMAMNYKELLGILETFNPKISESINIAEKGLNKIFPESRNRDIRHSILVLPHKNYERAIDRAAYLSNRDLEDKTVKAFHNDYQGVVFDYEYMVSERPFSDHGDENLVPILLHELMHQYSYKNLEETNGRRIVYEGLSVVSGPVSDKSKYDETKNVGLNEHITNYLGFKALLASGSAEKLSFKINENSSFVKFCREMDEVFGLDATREAYTKGQTELFELKLGSRFNDFSKALDHDNFKKALNLLAERKE